MVKPLAGIRVLDLTRFVSGAYCTMVLDALGADVIKVEGLPGGDPYRGQGAVRVGSLSGLFASLNTGKRSIAVDLTVPDGTELVRTLARGSDVFVENARPGSLARAGLGPDRLHGLNPRLVYASISGFGQTGPDGSRGGFDLILPAASGIMAVTGPEAGGPVKVGAPVLDIGAGMSAATAILAALFARTADGLGRTVSSSLLEFALGCFTSYAADMLETGTSPGLLGNDSPQFAPYGVFRCQDGSLALAGAGSEPLWLKLCSVLGRPDWAADPRFATNADRLRHRAELTVEIEQILTRESAGYWQQALDGAGIPASPVLPPAAALTSPQARALQACQAASTPDGYGYQTVRPPLAVTGPGSGPGSGETLGYSRGARSRPAHRRYPRRGRAGRGGDRGPDGPGGGGRMSITRPPQPGTGELAQLVLDRTIALSAIPAPTGHEQPRAEVVRGWWTAGGLRGVAVGAAGNVRAQLRAGDPHQPAVLLCAHLDTVFGPEVSHGVVRHGGRLTGPGVGDNTVAVCALSALDALLPGRLRHPVWIVATTGEEGLGNLAGVRALLDDPPGPVRAVIALEGNYLGRVNVTGVGSTRWRVRVTGPGGHAWEEASQPSAVHEAAGLTTDLAALAQPGPAQPGPANSGPPKATVNVGLIEGGESVNSRAQRAEFLVDLRSGDPAALDRLRAAARAVLDDQAVPLGVSVHAIGERPAGQLDPDHPLATLAAQVLREAGIPPRLTAASTDANAAYPRGIPALTLGITTGEGTHTEQEWIDVDPVAAGLAALATTVARLDEQEW
jgi:crotonobetainyl-CoA:carnitine CoA-transferase CaiB-like acyl-CoA transferase/acetylornithine deacetylase/succinyl-diaminopimelate desuccinylase-like protein